MAQACRGGSVVVLLWFCCPTVDHQFPIEECNFWSCSYVFATHIRPSMIFIPLCHCNNIRIVGPVSAFLGYWSPISVEKHSLLHHVCHAQTPILPWFLPVWRMVSDPTLDRQFNPLFAINMENNHNQQKKNVFLWTTKDWPWSFNPPIRNIPRIRIPIVGFLSADYERWCPIVSYIGLSPRQLGFLVDICN